MEKISLAGFTGTFFQAKEIFKTTPVLFIHGAFADHTGHSLGGLLAMKAAEENQNIPGFN